VIQRKAVHEEDRVARALRLHRKRDSIDRYGSRGHAANLFGDVASGEPPRPVMGGYVSAILYSRGRSMRVPTEYIRHAARAARKCAGDPLGGAPQPPDPEFYKTLAKALEEIASGLELVGKPPE
jgi:hypothetical protein